MEGVQERFFDVCNQKKMNPFLKKIQKIQEGRLSVEQNILNVSSEDRKSNVSVGEDNTKTKQLWICVFERKEHL